MEVKVRFTQKTMPKAKSGRYRVTLSLQAEGNQNTYIDGEEEIELLLSRKRFALQEGECYSVYPAAGSTGEYAEHLPHLVLERASIPWEYGQEDTPGLALFVAADDEGVVFSSLTVGEVSNLTLGTFAAPKLARTQLDADQKDDRVTVADIPAALFQSLRTSGEERRLLTHVKEVSLRDKVTDPTVKNGVFAVLLANRFLEEPKEGEAARKHHAFLVVMADYDGVVIPQNTKYVRCICLHRWEFAVNREPYGFAQAISQLDAGTLSSVVSEQVTDTRLHQVLERGYLPLNHELKEGSRMVSWYRSPFLPYEEQTELRPYSVFAEERIYYDPKIGMMDTGYACAWQLGRMIAMNQFTVASEVIRWRFSNYHLAVRQQQQAEILEGLPVIRDTLEESLKASLAQAANALPDYQEEMHE